ncbi:unnamed protein product [Boreogadus saida]
MCVLRVSAVTFIALLYSPPDLLSEIRGERTLTRASQWDPTEGACVHLRHGPRGRADPPEGNARPTRSYRPMAPKCPTPPHQSGPERATAPGGTPLHLMGGYKEAPQAPHRHCDCHGTEGAEGSPLISSLTFHRPGGP